MIVFWFVVVAGGLALSGVAADKALRAAEALGLRLGLSPFVIGLTIVAIGTDLPEIANSISAAAQGRGDLLVGDSTGSAATQITFVMGILCFIAVVKTRRLFVGSVGGMTVLALVVAALLMSDGDISRADAALLISGWLAGTFIVSRSQHVEVAVQPEMFGQSVLALGIQTLLALGVVGIGAIIAIRAFTEVTDGLGVPDYATSFFVLSVGTSLPELLVDGRALRQGAGALALGDLLGSSFVDSTLSLGIGPLLFPTDISDAAAEGTLIVAGIVALAVVVLLLRTEHRYVTGIMLFMLYLALYPLLIA